MLWGGRNTANKYHWHVWGVLAVSGPHWVCPCSWHMCFHGSTLLRLQVALQGNCLMEAIGSLHFPSLRRSASGSLILHKGADLFESILCLSHVRAAQATMCLESVLSQVCGVSYHLPGPSCLVSWLHLQSTVSHVLCVSSGELISDCNHPGGCQLSRISGRLG